MHTLRQVTRHFHLCSTDCLCVVTHVSPGTTFTISRTFQWADCQNGAVTRVTGRTALLASGGDKYWVDGNNCLHMKLMDPGQPWEWTKGFSRDGMYIEETVRGLGIGPEGTGGLCHVCSSFLANDIVAYKCEQKAAVEHEHMLRYCEATGFAMEIGNMCGSRVRIWGLI